MSNVQQPSVLQPSDLNATFMSRSNQRGAKITNPNTGKLSFGRIPKNNNGIPEGEIYLKLGVVGFGNQRTGALGARHIWEKHKVDLNIAAPEDVPAKIAQLMQVGSSVLVDFNANYSPERVVVLNTSIGRVALKQEQQDGGGISYSIISAYGSRNAPGTLIGTLKSPND